MRALVTRSFGTPPAMIVESRPVPVDQDGETVVRIRAATINQLSNTVRTGQVGVAKAPLVLGNEAAGTVVSSAKFAAGTAVVVYGAGQLGMTEDGLQQEYVRVSDKRVFALPDGLDFDTGSALTVNYITAYRALTRVAQIEAGQTVLIPGATGALGHALMQTAQVFGARPIAVVSTASKAARARQAGAERVIDLSTGDLLAEVARLTGGVGADIALDPVGGEMTGRLLAALRPRAAVVAIGFAGGVTASFDLVDLIVHEKRVVGYDLHLESDRDAELAFAWISRYAAAGKLRPLIDSMFTLANFEAGFQRLTSRQACGAIVLQL
ncbi:quinone oxidoreductase family protein [Paraburkholderia tropica]|uniref:quinone oxidoreductase family protein n=1 Tax=Paraburkholderia tropica TaxID=92647 RepID=UPI0015928646|nr:zinc-binding alcohol dehydrogenase family protein [Paraburkholderia tropica]